jgi:hypothetical protein
MNIREDRIDIVRGLAIIIIIINHLTLAFQFYGLHGYGVVTPTSLGYSSAAELFVIMSGYMVGMIYLQKPSPTKAVLRRARTLFFYNSLMFAAILPLLYVMDASELHYWRLNALVENPVKSTLLFFIMLYGPNLLDVLQLYVTLMLATPLAIAIYGRSPSGLIILSTIIYVGVQVMWASHLLPALSMGSTFNPLAWQIIFFVPMTLGAARSHEWLFQVFEGKRYLIPSLLALFAVIAIAKLAGFGKSIPGYGSLTSRDHLGLLRLGHAALMVFLYAGLLAVTSEFRKRAPFKAIACVGRHSLNCFTLSVVITYGFSIAWDRMDGGYLGYIGCVVFSILLTIFAAGAWDVRARARLKPTPLVHR